VRLALPAKLESLTPLLKHSEGLLWGRGRAVVSRFMQSQGGRDTDGRDLGEKVEGEKAGAVGWR